ncbi:MAG: HEAT repeat domain-containing protein [Spirochaetota bacterium]|nr:HEAT repeat domain-containing protein [Spirochaetota bacterium]
MIIREIKRRLCYNNIIYLFFNLNHSLPAPLSTKYLTISMPFTVCKRHPNSIDIHYYNLSKLLLGKIYILIILFIFLTHLDLSAESKQVDTSQNPKTVKKQESDKDLKPLSVKNKSVTNNIEEVGKEKNNRKTKKESKLDKKKNEEIAKDNAPDEVMTEEEQIKFEKEKKKADRLEKIIDLGTHKERKEAINLFLTMKNKKIKERLGKKLIDLIKNEIDSDVKVKSITVAGEMKIRNAVPELLNTLNDESEDVRIASVYAIKRIGDTSTKPTLILKIKEQKLDENSNYIEALIDTLGEFNTVELSEYAIEAIKDDQTTKNIREQLILFLGKIDSRKSKNFLIDVLKNEEEEKVSRAFAANSLAKLGIKEAAKDIDEVIKTIESYTFKKKKKYYNLYIYCLAALAKLGDEKAVPRLINSLRSDNAVVRLKAIMLIKELKDKRTIDILKYKMNYDQSRSVQSAARKALKELGVDTEEKQESEKNENSEKNNAKKDKDEKPKAEEKIKKEKKGKSDVQK